LSAANHLIERNWIMPKKSAGKTTVRKASTSKASTSKALTSPSKNSPSKKPGKAVKEPPRGAPTTDQDPKRRLGNFTGAGEAPRKGYRTSGINGPQKRREAAKRAGKKQGD
jgi:hypothetical protein